LLADEKEFNADASAFWSGGYLLEGLIDKERFDANVVTISGRLIPPDEANPVLLELASARTNLPALVDDLAHKILEVAERRMELRAWDPAAEAAQYWDEAQWAAKWRMWRTAQAASEASWALGLRTKELAEMRVRVWQETGLNRAACTFDLDQVRVNYSAPPDVDRLADLRRAGDLFEAGWNQFIASQTPLDAKWFELGAVLVADLSAWLRHFYFMPEARVGMELQIQETQQQAERIWIPQRRAGWLC
jgi:hypothetical protein